jgi:hypothetical protein
MPKQLMVLAGLAAGCMSVAAQHTKELTARELFYTAVDKPAAKAVETKPVAKPPSKVTTPVAKAEKKSVPRPVSTTPPPAAPTSPDGTAIITASTRRTAPAPSGGPALGLRYTITKLMDGHMVEVPPDSSFREGDRIKVTVVPNTSGYLYIISQGSSGTWRPMFPSSEVEDGNNRVDGFHDYAMPPKSRFIFDSQPGTERLFVILSREPETDLEQLIYSLQSPGKTQPAAEPTEGPKQPKTLVAANISNDMVGRMRNVYARDLVIEKVDEETPGDRKEKAVYVVNPSGSPSSRVVADIALVHQ